MSIDLNWDTLTTGPDGLELAERIRDFIHSKFQAVALPRFIKSVTVHDFEFGSIAPELELKDITDPLPDFYEENEAADEAESEEEGEEEEGGEDDSSSSGNDEGRPEQRATLRGGNGESGHRHELSGSSLLGSTTARPATAAGAAGAAARPSGGVPGGTSNLLHHFHSHLTPGWSGTQTPLAAMAGAHLGGGGGGGRGHGGGGGSGGGGSGGSGGVSTSSTGSRAGGGHSGADQPRPRHDRNPSYSSSISMGGGPDGGPAAAAAAAAKAAAAASSSSSAYSSATNLALLRPVLREKHSVSTLAPTSAGIPSRPPTRDANVAGLSGSGAAPEEDKDKEAAGKSRRAAAATATAAAAAAAASDGEAEKGEPRGPHGQQRPYEPRAEDMQAVFRIRYAGDIKLLLTADILLDYPMPSFVGIPVRLSITGLTFDGVGVLASIRRRIHFCFLGPEDALAAVGADDDDDDDADPDRDRDRDDDNDGERAAATRFSLHGAAAARSAALPPGSTTPAVPPAAPPKPRTRVGGLLQEVRVESEIGQRQGGKQSLKNVGKVERFVLEQVRRIFEEEFVYPSFWTFLV